MLARVDVDKAERDGEHERLSKKGKRKKDKTSTKKAATDISARDPKRARAADDGNSVTRDAYSLDGLEARLAATSSYLNRRVSLIPAQHYFAKSAEEEVELAGKFAHNKAAKAPKQVIKEASRKAKRLRLDPDANPTVPEIQLELAALDAAAAAAAADTVVPARHDGSAAATTTSGTADNGTAGPHVGISAPRTVLQKRLEERINQLKGKRNSKEAPARALPKGDKKGKKLKAKLLAEEAAKKKAIVATPRADGIASPGGRPAVANGDGSVVFSKFDFSTAERVGSKKKKGPQTPMQLLAKAQSDRERLEKLKNEDPEKAEEIETKTKWKNALLKASGTKVRDDERLLKKMIKRKEITKKRTQKEWSERTATVKKFQDEKQKKRRENIKERSKAKIEKKINRGKTKTKDKKKSSKKRPGFEGGSSPPKKPKQQMTLQEGYKKKK